MPVTNPLPDQFSINRLRPTQMSVGYREVRRKRREWRCQSDILRQKHLSGHPIPVVIGPGSIPWLIDKHHLVRALYEEGVDDVPVLVVADLRDSGIAGFLKFMNDQGWIHPFDRNGNRCPVNELPRHVCGLQDDPFRSLASEVRRAGGFAKVRSPFTEFAWADFLRQQISNDEVDDDFDTVVTAARAICQCSCAAHLPGWLGSVDTSKAPQPA